jgi:enamine deaminase RidA (YjgF/YER057c/UK114 family)
MVQEVRMKTMNTAFVAAVAVVLVVVGPAGAGEPNQTIFVPEGWGGAYDFGYAPVIRTGNMVIVSGVPASGPGTYEQKIRRMYDRISSLLEAAGAGIDDIVELTSFHAEAVDSQSFREEFELYMPIHKEFFGDHAPAWTAVGTTALLSPSAPVEVRVVAIVGSGAQRKVVREGARPPHTKESDDDSEDTNNRGR